MYKYSKNSSILKIVLASALSFAIGFGFAGSEVFQKGEAFQFTSFEREEVENPQNVDLGLYWKVWDVLEEDYFDVEEISDEEMIYGSIEGLVSSLEDPYTVFMDPQDSKEFSDSLHGELEGIGAELTEEDGVLTIVAPLKDSPAEKAGLLPKDIIYKIEDEFAADYSMYEAIMKIRGEKGTPVNLTILREGADDPIEVTIVRDSIIIDTVDMEELEDDIFYMSISQFNDQTFDEFKEKASTLLIENVNGLIIDLRFNGGGYLMPAVEILGYLLPDDLPAVVIKERGEADDVMYTDSQIKIENIPLVVLVNEGSASASEIVAGAIQDHERGVLMGQQTFGKGSVQEVLFFEDGSSIRLTIAKWFTPDGTNIDEVGLTPDMEIEITDEDIENEFDRQKEEAIRYLQELNT